MDTARLGRVQLHDRVVGLAARAHNRLRALVGERLPTRRRG